MRREADDLLLNAIAHGRFAYVLAPRAAGKSSLMGRTIRRLRADGQQAAVVDLTQIGTRLHDVDSARWHYSIAYRICRELRLKVDLQDWWHERSLLLNEQRLAEFFWDIVLAKTTVPVTIFFDDVERAVDMQFSMELFAALNSCYQRRVSEPDYSRLNFVALGVASPEQLCPDPSVSPFIDGVAISLDDFSLAECSVLAGGVEQPEEKVQKLLERIYSWTHGQPYLTQKLLRGAARRGGNPGDVDAALHELFLSSGISREEPLLSHMRSRLTDGSMRGRQAAAILRRLAKGSEVIDDRASAAQLRLRLGGFVTSDENGMLRFRNRIVEHAFEPGSIATIRRSRSQRTAIGAAAAAAAIVLLGIWYVGILPRPYIDTLALVNTDYALAQQAYQRLHAFPGFGRRAERLYADVMTRRSFAAQTLSEALEADAVLRDVLNREALADELIADFWLRRAEAAAHRGDRDAALIYAISADESGSEAAASLASNLIDGDYSMLQQSLKLDSPVVDFEVDWDLAEVTVVDDQGRIHRKPFAPPADDGRAASIGARQSLAMALSAPQHVGVTVGQFVDEPGNAGALQLRIVVEHRRTSDLLVRLRAPSGAAAEIDLPERGGTVEQFVFTASSDNGLARLAQESITGPWELTVFDRLAGETGRLISWGLSFPGVPQFWDDDPIDGLPLPDPLDTSQVDVSLSASGNRAVALPAGADARGSASVWDLAASEPIAVLPLAGSADYVDLLRDDRLLIVGPLRATLWRADQAVQLLDRVAAGGFVDRPAVSLDGGQFALAERDADRVRVRVFDVEDGRSLGSFTTSRWARWALAPNAEYVVTFDDVRRARLLETQNGSLIAELFHDADVIRVIAAPGRIVVVDELGEVFAWNLQDERRTYATDDAIYLGTTTHPESVALAMPSDRLTFVDAAGLVNVSRLSDGYRQTVLDHGAGPAIGVRLDPESDGLISAASRELRYWRLSGSEPDGYDFGSLTAVAIGPSGAMAVLGNRSGQVRVVHDLANAVLQGTESKPDHVGHRGGVTRLGFNRDGRLAASGGSDGLVRVWNTETGAPGRYLMRHPQGPIVALAFGPGDRWLVSGGRGSARVFDLETGSLIREIGVDGDAQAVAISPDGLTVAVGDSAGNIFLAAPDRAQGVRAIRGRSPITALEFADDADVLASGSSDGTLVLWDTLQATAMEGAHVFSGPIRWIQLAPGATRILVQSGAWIHSLDRESSGPVTTSSRLLPSQLRLGSSIVQTETDRVRALASIGGGRLALADVELATVPGPGPLPRPSGLRIGASDAGASAVNGRPWARILSLQTDAVSGEVRASPP